MRKVFLTVLTFTFINFSFAQLDWGAKAGLNYNFGGDLSEVFSETGSNIENIVNTNADGKAGFHLGLWTKFHVLGLYIRPELVYTKLNNSYGTNTQNNRGESDYKTQKLDIPILIGTKLIGPLHIFGGPSFQYILDSDFEVNTIGDIKTNDLSVGLQLGTGLELGRLGIDVRWEKGFSNDADGRFLNTNFNVDNRPNQIIFGLSYQFNEKD